MVLVIYCMVIYVFHVPLKILEKHFRLEQDSRDDDQPSSRFIEVIPPTNIEQSLMK